MELVNLAEYRSRDTVAVLKFALQMALKGELDGLVLCLEHADGTDSTYATGCCHHDRRVALGAISRSWMQYASDPN